MKHLLSFIVCIFTPGCSALGFFRYGLPQLKKGSLRAGDSFVEVNLVRRDGSPVALSEFIGKHPLVLVFGSFT